MNPPRWFWLVLATVIVLVGLSAAFRNYMAASETWQYVASDDVIFKPRTGVICGVENRKHYCVNLSTGEPLSKPPGRW